MNERLVLMPCHCRIYLDYNLALKEVTILDNNSEMVILKVKCLYCHKTKRHQIGIASFYKMFGSHLEDL